MEAPCIEVLTLRLDVLSVTLAELAKALPPVEAARAGRAIREQMVHLICDRPMSGDAAESIATDLAPLLSALQRP